MSSKKLHRVVAIAALLGLSGAAWWWQHRVPVGEAMAAQTEGKGAAAKPGDKKDAKDGKPAGPIPVEAGRVQRADLADEAQAVGSLRAAQAVMLKPEVSGRIVKLGFGDGQMVRQGQLLVQLDDALQVAQLQQAEAQAGIARTQLQRNRELLAQNFVSANAVDQAQAALQVAEAQVALNKAQLARMQVRAPFSGRAGIRAVNLGDYIKDGSDLVSLEDASSMWVDFRLPERYVPRLKAGQQVEVSLDAWPGRKFNARIEALDTALDAAGRSLLVRARIQDVAPELKSGLFARVRVVLATHAGALLVPEEALVPLAGKQFVIKLVEEEGQLKARRIEAKLGLRLNGQVELLEGLKEGERVVTAGQAKLLRGDGQAVKVVDVDSKKAGKPAGAGSAPAASSPASSAASR